MNLVTIEQVKQNIFNILFDETTAFLEKEEMLVIYAKDIVGIHVSREKLIDLLTLIRNNLITSDDDYDNYDDVLYTILCYLTGFCGPHLRI
ncbi:MAG TPA: hypothetical protein VLL52_09445 [Anaerolineae bacterium]|nr:hypothetical protein [Anaerolineae bacterium]